MSEAELQALRRALHSLCYDALPIEAFHHDEDGSLVIKTPRVPGYYKISVTKVSPLVGNER